ncbi:addiction module protein [Campylobacter fetus subsp. testudinum]|uniref:Fic family protein n=1 Tax=Campylobacter fetus TaxID=196 RepID=UPI00081881AE|nr:Fic/DOC family N-terminal domain-containing protein [Campylobacter fetus]OCR95418.1 addiction module protein [Campylobacter fetus subsp. testudinum]OCR99087.1 addiction module protein [Campylobacter fetus subsp. testudinum]
MKKEFIPAELPLNLNLDKHINKLLISASRSLSELNGLIKTIPNQDILINSLILQESKDSSAIENIITTNDELFLAMIDEKEITQNAKEVMNYEAALKKGYNLLKKDNLLLSKHIIQIQKRLEQNNAGFRTQSGTMLKNPATGEIKHIPPQHIDDINRLMINLQNYINEDLDDLDPLIRLAVIHYQFETIHPFYDGNGRTGRILNVLYLVYKGLLELPILYLSAYIIQNKVKYYELLENVSKNSMWNEWIEYILKGIEKTSIATIEIIKDINTSIDEISYILQVKQPKMYSKDFVELLFSYPYTKTEFVINKLNISRQTSSKYLKTCEKLNILKCIKLGNTNFYVNERLFQILNKGIVC